MYVFIFLLFLFPRLSMLPFLWDSFLHVGLPQVFYNCFTIFVGDLIFDGNYLSLDCEDLPIAASTCLKGSQDLKFLSQFPSCDFWTSQGAKKRYIPCVDPACSSLSW